MSLNAVCKMPRSSFDKEVSDMVGVYKSIKGFLERNGAYGTLVLYNAVVGAFLCWSCYSATRRWWVDVTTVVMSLILEGYGCRVCLEGGTKHLALAEAGSRRLVT
jgi:hypothetical protein